MLYLEIKEKNGKVKFNAKGSEIKKVYKGEFNAGDQIYLRLDGVDTVAIKFDEKMQESTQKFTKPLHGHFGR